MKPYRWSFYVAVSFLTILSLILQPVMSVIALPARAPIAKPVAVEQESVPPAASEGLASSAAISYTVHLPIVMRNYTSPAPIEAEIKPGVGGEVGSPDSAVHVKFTGAAVTQTVVARYESTLPPALPPDQLGVAGPAFQWSARTVSGASVSEFPYQVTILPGTELTPAISIVTPTVTIQVQYTSQEVWGLDLSTLFLYRRTATGWEMTPSYADRTRNVIYAEVDRSGEFVPMARLAIYAPASAPRVGLRASAAQSVTLKLALDPDDDVGHAYWPGVGEVREGATAYQLAQETQQRFATNRCQVDILITRSAGQTYVSRSTRAQQAADFGAEMFVTLAFNALTGSPWGYEGNGGVVTWARSRGDDQALAGEFYTQIPAYTGRPHTRPVQPGPFYGEFGGLSATYSHVETLFLDHNYDWPVINTNFSLVVDATYAALASQLSADGLTCFDAGGNPIPPPLPPLPSAELLQRLRDLGRQNYERYGADPVSFSTGNHVVSVPLVRMSGRGGLDFDFTLTYNAQDGRDDLFGYNWSFPYNARLQRYGDDSIVVTLSDGRSYRFTWNGSGYDAPAGVFDRLEKTSDGWRFSTPDETVLTFKEVIATYSGFGVLTEWRDRAGNALHFEYDLSGQNNWEQRQAVPRPPLTTIRDDANRVIQVQSNGDSHITALHLFDGRTLTFGYADGDLTSITDPNNGTRRYEYDSRHRLTKERDAENILFLQNNYDDRDRVVEQIDASGAHNYLVYDPINRVTTFTDNGGKVTRYFYDEQNRVTRVEDANSQSTHDGYDANYNLTQHTDARGNLTQYAYDARGNLIERRDPVEANDLYTSDVTRWAYNDRNLVTSMTNALNKTWWYEYDANGNLTKSTAPDGSFTTATYNTWGQPTSLTDANGHTTTYIYDTYGNRVQTIDALGHASTSTYDTAGRETSFTDANGHAVHFTYDGNGNIRQIRDPKAHLSIFEYDRNDLLTRSVDRRGAERVYQYNDDLKLTSERDPLLRWQNYQYDALYRRTTSTDALGRVTQYAYDALGQLSAVTDPLSQTTRYEYDATGNVSASIDPLGQRTRMTYDANNRLKFLIDAAGYRTEYCYDAEDRLVRTIGPRGEVTDYTYDKLNRLIAVKNPLGQVTHYEFDPAGNRVAEITPLGYRTDTHYDALNRPVKIEQPIQPIGLRPTTQYEYDAVGNTLAITNPRGFVTHFGYDVNDNVIMQTDALNGVTQFVYDAEDNLIHVIDANGHAISTTFNLAGLPISTQDALGNTTTRDYDAANNLIETIDALNHPATYDYDPLNRLVRATDALSHTTQYTRDAVGRVTRVLDANAHATDYAYDALGRLIAVTDALSGTTRYAYDAVGNLTVITDANAHVTTFDYNFLNQLKQETNPISHTWRYNYDAAGRLISRIDAMWQATYYDYDSSGRLTQVHYGVTPPTLHPITFTYDLDGNETQMCDALGCTTHAYDALDRRTVTVDWQGRAITRTYNAVGNPIGLAYPNGNAVAYQYDAANRLSAVVDPHGSASQYQHNKLGQVTQIDRANGTRAAFTYDAANRLTGLDQRQLNAAQPQSTYQYLLDAVGNRVQVDEVRAAFDGTASVITLTHAYQYDALNRLIDAATAAPSTGTAYAFDAAGNRLSKTGSVLTPDANVPALPVAPRPENVAYQYNAANQLTGIGDQGSDTALGYNPNGDRITQTQVLTDGAASLTAYVYDREDRLTNVTKSISDSAALTVTMVVTYTYDGYGRRAIKDVLDFTTPITHHASLITYLYDGLDIIGAQLATAVVTASQAVTPAWTITESYYYLAPSPITGLRRPAEMERLPNAATGFAGDRYWYQTDGLDSIVALTDESGNLVSPLLYDEYGNQLAGSTDLQLFTYTAQDFDAETGLIHFYARYYDPQTGVWLSQDVWRGRETNPSTLHRYSYISGRAISAFDVFGFAECADLGCHLSSFWEGIKETGRNVKATVETTYEVYKNGLTKDFWGTDNQYTYQQNLDQRLNELATQNKSKKNYIDTVKQLQDSRKVSIHGLRGIKGQIQLVYIFEYDPNLLDQLSQFEQQYLFSKLKYGELTGEGNILSQNVSLQLARSEAGFQTMLEGTDFIVGLMPVYGNIHSGIQAVSGRNLITGESLTDEERALAGVDAVSVLKYLKSVKKGGRVVQTLVKVGSGADNLSSIYNVATATCGKQFCVGQELSTQDRADRLIDWAAGEITDATLKKLLKKGGNTIEVSSEPFYDANGQYYLPGFEPTGPGGQLYLPGLYYP